MKPLDKNTTLPVSPKPPTKVPTGQPRMTTAEFKAFSKAVAKEMVEALNRSSLKN